MKLYCGLGRAARQQAEEHANSLEHVTRQQAAASDQLQAQHAAALEAARQQHAHELEELQKHSRKALKAAARRSSQSHHQVMECNAMTWQAKRYDRCCCRAALHGNRMNMRLVISC